MPASVKEELWKQPGHLGMIIVTTNASITQDGRLVMGRGAAHDFTVSRVEHQAWFSVTK